MKAYPVSADQKEELRRLIQMHFEATGSKKAEAVLADFEAFLPKIKAVISDEYLAHLKGA